MKNRLWLIVAPDGNILQWPGVEAGRFYDFYWWPRNPDPDRGVGASFTKRQARAILTYMIRSGGPDQRYHETCRVIGVAWRDPETFSLSDKQQAEALLTEVKQLLQESGPMLSTATKRARSTTKKPLLFPR